MSGWTLRIEHADGTTSTLSVADGEAATLRITDRLDRAPDAAAEAEVAVFRDAWRAVETKLDVTNDRVYIDAPSGETVFGGRVRDVEGEGTTVSVLLDGPKRDALDGAISGPAVSYGPTDDTNIVADLLARTPTLSAGTIEGQTALAFSESNAAPGPSLAKLAQATGADVRYRPDFTVDYLGRAGTDRTDETLSAAAGTVIGEPRVRRDDRETVTHVTVLGAGEGTAQTRATSVVASYSAGDRRVDKVVRDKDIAREAAAQELADRVVEDVESSPRHLDVELEIPASVAPSLGDTFVVDLPRQDVDTEELKVMELTRLLDAAGDRFRAILSSRETTREQQGTQSARELDSLAAGNPGQYFALPVSAGFDRVDSGEPLAFKFPYPEDVVEEFRAYVEVDSREYRLPAAQTGHTHDVSIGTTTALQNDSFDSVITSDVGYQTVSLTGGNGWQDVDTFTLTASNGLLAMGASDLYVADAGNNNTGSHYVRLVNKATGTAFGGRAPAFSSTGGGSHFGIIPEDFTNETLAWQIDPRSADKSFLIGTRWMGVGRHRHDVDIGTETTDSVAAVDPGINTQAGETATNVAVAVNGTQIDTVGDDPQSARVDLTGVLADGSNDIKITTDSLGELRATVFVEGIKNATR